MNIGEQEVQSARTAFLSLTSFSRGAAITQSRPGRMYNCVRVKFDSHPMRCGRSAVTQGPRARLLSLPVLALLLAPVAASPRAFAASAQKENPKTIRVATSLVLVDAVVRDKSGRVVDGLTRDDFEVTDDGFTQVISHFSRDQLPLAIALVVDLSSSIIPYLEQLHQSTQAALQSLKPEDQVALFTFAFSVEKRADLTPDKNAVADQLEGLTTGGSTNINDALYQAAQYLNLKAPDARRVIILISDDVASQEGDLSSKEVENEIIKADAVLYSLRIPGNNSYFVQKYIERVGPGRLVNVGKVAPRTGGEILDVQKEGSLSSAFAELIQGLRARYAIGYTPDHSAQDGRFHSLEVRMVSGRCPGCTVRAKRSYFAKPAGPASTK